MLRACSLRPHILLQTSTAVQCRAPGGAARHSQNLHFTTSTSFRAPALPSVLPTPVSLQRDPSPHGVQHPVSTYVNGSEELDFFLLEEEERPTRVSVIPDRAPKRPIEALGFVVDVDSDGETWAVGLKTMAESSSALDAFNAFQTMRYDEGDHIPEQYLHRLMALMAWVRPRTRELHEQMKAVVEYIQEHGGVLRLTEWTTLMDAAGKGWRRVQPEDYQASLDVFADMSASYEPDIVAYTALLNIACRSLSPKLVQHAATMLRGSGLAPNTVTHLCMMSYFTYRKDLAGVRSTVLKMQQQGLDLDCNVIRSFMWACGYNDDVNVASTMYRIIRHNLVPEEPAAIQPALDWLAQTECMTIPPSMVPEKVTYRTMIQIFAYQGDIMRALHVFMDMLSSDSSVDTMPAFRAIFIGFVKHAGNPRKRDWSHQNLSQLFDSFLALPVGTSPPRDRVIYWIILAFVKVGASEKTVLREVWRKLEDKYGQNWGARLNRVRNLAFNAGDNARVTEKSMYGTGEQNKTYR